MRYISIIHKYHLSCSDHPDYSPLIPRRGVKKPKFSAFEIQPDEVIEIENEKERAESQSERFTWEDSYRDAGGGDEWSDPSEFW